LEASLLVDGGQRRLRGQGNGPIDSFVEALREIGIDLRVLDYHEHAVGAGADAKAAAYIEAAVGDHVLWGVGIHASIVTASLRAVASAINRASRISGTRSDAPPCRGDAAGGDLDGKVAPGLPGATGHGSYAD